MKLKSNCLWYLKNFPADHWQYDLNITLSRLERVVKGFVTAWELWFKMGSTFSYMKQTEEHLRYNVPFNPPEDGDWFYSWSARP